MKSIAIVLLAALSSGCALTNERVDESRQAKEVAAMWMSVAKATCELKGYHEASAQEADKMLARAEHQFDIADARSKAKDQEQDKMITRNVQEYAKAYKRNGGKDSKELREIEASGDRLIQAYEADDSYEREFDNAMRMMVEAGKLEQNGKDFRNCVIVEWNAAREERERNRANNNIHCTSLRWGGMSTTDCY